MKLQAIKGMPDILPGESEKWQALEKCARNIFAAYGYSEIRTPAIEPTELFKRSVGEETDVVQKQMYTFASESGKSLSLRPEGTAPVVRAYIEHSLQSQDAVTKLYYMGPMFRYERPQKGRQRQFHQIGAELFGSDAPLADAEMITLLSRFLLSAGGSKMKLEINSLGCSECRPLFISAFQDYLKSQKSKLCENCERRMTTNPLRVLDCKNTECHAIASHGPIIAESWCDSCREHFDAVKHFLSAADVSFHENHNIVRGLDYYCRTIFEVTAEGLGAQDAIAAGGRYDGLVKQLGGGDVAGVGFAIGFERLLLALGEKTFAGIKGCDFYFALLGEAAQKEAFPIVEKLRSLGKSVEMGFSGSLKSQMRRAGKLAAKEVVIVGEEEVKNKKVTIKNMGSGKQIEVSLTEIINVCNEPTPAAS